MRVTPSSVARLACALVAMASAGACSREAPRIERPNVVLVTLDTTRADHLSVYGYERQTSPHLEALAAESSVYEYAYSTASWTLPAHASLFTGRYPSSHGARHDPEGSLVLADAIDAPEGIRARRMATGERTLARLLSENGYDTAGIVAGPWMLSLFGLGEGFDHYDDDGIRDSVGRRAQDVTERARDWLTQRAEEPFFLFLNYFDPHLPYLPPAGWARSFLPAGVRPNPRDARQARDLYDAEILYMDHELGRVFDLLRERGLWDRTLVIVTGDHGELLGDRGLWGHERFLWEPLVRVPLLVKPPGPSRPGTRETERVSIVDVLPLVLRELGIELPDGVQGAAPPDARRPLLAEVRPMSARGDTGDWRASWRGSEKWLESSLGERLLFDLEADPAETRNLAAESPRRAADAARALEEAFASLPPAGPDGGPLEVDAATAEALRAFGYLEDAEADGPSEEETARSQTEMDPSE